MNFKTIVKMQSCEKCGLRFRLRGIHTHRKWCKGNLNQAMPVPDYGDNDIKDQALPKRSQRKLASYLQLIGIMVSKHVIEDLDIEPMIKAMVEKTNKYVLETE